MGYAYSEQLPEDEAGLSQHITGGTAKLNGVLVPEEMTKRYFLKEKFCPFRDY